MARPIRPMPTSPTIFSDCSVMVPVSSFDAASQRQMLPQERFVCPQNVARSLEHDLSLVENVVAVGDGERCPEVLLDDQHRHASLPDAADDFDDLLDNERREAFRGLIEDEEPRIQEKRARNREHLLLAT